MLFLALSDGKIDCPRVFQLAEKLENGITTFNSKT